MNNTLVSNHFELADLLRSKLGDDVDIDSMAILMGKVCGTYKGQKFNITFKRKAYLLISIAKTDTDLLKEIEPILNDAMGEQPICSYSLQSAGLEENQAMPTIEWDFEDPENRIKEVVNGRAFSDGAKLHNLILFGNREISSYVEDDKAKADRIANARIYGIDPGYIKDPEKIKNMSEIDLYFMIETLGGIMFSAWHATKRDTQPADLTEEQYAMEFCVYQTKKFGVDDLPEPEIDKHIPRTSKYNTWYTFYNNHFKNVLTNEQWNAFQIARKENKCVLEFMPKGNWKDQLT
ncbi:MAG: hypothetical protein K0R72_704 [Clostridia bacterium]|jgi:hypothetical protein|nr:hypothetical protein [Clostridia bacterium]